MDIIFLPLILGWIVVLPGLFFAANYQKDGRKFAVTVLSSVLILPWLGLLLLLFTDERWMWKDYADMLLRGFFAPGRFRAGEALKASIMFWLTNCAYGVYIIRLFSGWPRTHKFERPEIKLK
jgi:hypothetical protein